MGLRLAVVIATVGRAEITRLTVDRLADQTRPADRILVIGASPQDVAGVERARGAPEILLTEKGLCRQRNAGLNALGEEADIAIFFDDDFVPAADFLAEVEAVFAARPELAAATGRIVADGINNRGYTLDEAAAFLAADQRPEAAEYPMSSLYGCNMVIRLSTARDLRFDERLPLYGWQEDIDFTYQLNWRGPLIKSTRLNGVHMGIKGGRTSGTRFGYSQVANPVYLAGKGTMPKDFAFKLISRNLMANLAGVVRGDPFIDRKGRLLGNLMAGWDWMRRRMSPERMLEID